VDVPLIELTGIIACLLFSAFFSGAETALTSLSEVDTHQLIEENKRTGRALVHWQKNHTGVLTTILIGNNLANITASALAADLASIYFSKNGIPIAIGVMTLLLLFTGEITPKTFARAYSKQIAIPAIHVVLGFYVLFFPLTIILSRFIHILLWVFGRGANDNRGVTEKDIEYIVSLGRKEGSIHPDKEDLLTSIFEFTDTTAREVMVPRTDMTALPVETPYDDVIDLMLESGYSRIPVFEESADKILGIFYTRDLLPVPAPEDKSNFLSKHLRPAVYVPESKKISEILRLFQAERVHMAIVVDEFGGTEGVVTMEDIIEELLGEIQDEFDPDDERLIALPDGTYIADARVNVEDLEDSLGYSFPEDREYESLGGFLMEVSGDVPAEGWRYHHEGYIFEVTEADVNRAIRVKISPAPQDLDEDIDEALNDQEVLKKVGNSKAD